MKPHSSRPNLNQELKDLGYDDPLARWSMINSHKKGGAENRDKMIPGLRERNTPADRERRMKQAIKKGEETLAEMGWVKPSKSTGGGSGGAKPYYTKEEVMQMSDRCKGLISDELRRSFREKLSKVTSKEEADAAIEEIKPELKKGEKKKAEKAHHTYGPLRDHFGLPRLAALEKMLGDGDCGGQGDEGARKLIKLLVNGTDKAAADAMIADWERICNMPAGKGKNGELIKLTKLY
jgi:hypothetical protein